jgi:AraC-like DNA-binding protein
MSVVFLIGGVQAFFLAFVFAYNKSPVLAARFLKVWITFLGIHLTVVYLSATGFFKHHPQYFSLTTSLLLLEGPFLYFYVLLATNKIQKLKIGFLAHAFPFLFFTSYFFYRINLPAVVDRYELIRNILSDSSNIIVQVFGLFNHLHLIVYLILSIRAIRQYTRQISDEFSYTDDINLAWLKNVIVGMTAISVLIVAGLILSDLFLFTSHDFKAYMIYSAFSALPFYLSFFAIRQKIIYPTAIAENFGSKYESSGLSKDDSKELASTLEELMKRKQLHLNAKLALKDLAAELSIHPKRLSQVINENFNQNFFNYINTYRVEEFKKRVHGKKFDHYTLLSIGLDCGFNTKSSFNSIFKKFTGMTPSEYKASLTGGKS